MPTPNPCINCLTYMICKSELLAENHKQMQMTHMFPAQIDPEDHVLYKAYENTLRHKCSLIRSYIVMQLTESWTLEQVTIEVLKEAYKNINPWE